MEGCHYRHFKVFQQLHDVVPGFTSEDSIFMLQAHHIYVARIQIVGGPSVGSNVTFADFESHPLWVRVA
jgi:hypothetical protein